MAELEVIKNGKT